MENLLKKIRVEINPDIHIKDPFSSLLGKDIILNGISLMHKLGFEQFTFKKLAATIDCTESAIYRYFENKHKFLLFLNSWYWGYLDQNFVFVTANLTDPNQKLQIAIKILVTGPVFTQNDFIDPISLRNLLTDEANKAFMTKEVDEEYQKGFFSYFNKLSDRIAEIILEINPNYEYPKTLVATLMESSLIQSYYAKHLPGLTEQKLGDEKRVDFFNNLIFKTIQNEN